MTVREQLEQIRNNPQAMRNPAIRSTFEFLDKKDRSGLLGLLGNACSTRGVDSKELLEKLGQMNR